MGCLAASYFRADFELASENIEINFFVHLSLIEEQKNGATQPLAWASRPPYHGYTMDLQVKLGSSQVQAVILHHCSLI